MTKEYKSTKINYISYIKYSLMETCLALVPRHDSPIDQAAAGKLVEVLAGWDSLVHLTGELICPHGTGARPAHGG